MDDRVVTGRSRAMLVATVLLFVATIAALITVILVSLPPSAAVIPPAPDAVAAEAASSKSLEGAPAPRVPSPVPSSGALRIRAIDAASRAALPDAVLRLGARKRLVDVNSFVAIGRAGEDGLIEIHPDRVRHLTPSSTLSVSCSGHAPAWVEPELLGTASVVEVALEPTASVRVRVVEDSTDGPVEGAVVLLADGSSPIDPGLLLAPSESTKAKLSSLVAGTRHGSIAFGTTASDGFAVLEGLAPADYGVGVFKEGMWRFETSDLRDTKNAHVVAVSRGQQATVEARLAPLLLAVATADEGVDVVGAYGKAKGLHWSAVALVPAIDRVIRQRFPRAVWHRFGFLTRGAVAEASVSVFVEGRGWRTQPVDVVPFPEATGTRIIDFVDCGIMSGTARIEFVARDGRALPVESCEVKAVEGSFGRSVVVGVDTRLPPGRYRVGLGQANWLNEEVGRVVVDVPAGGSTVQRVVAGEGLVRVRLDAQAFDGDPVPSVSVFVSRLNDNKRVVAFTAGSQDLKFVLPRDAQAGGFRIQVSAPGLAGSVLLAADQLATEGVIPLLVRLEPKSRRP